MTLPIHQERSLPQLAKLLLALALALCAPLAIAQNNLGELLDAGGKLMSAEEFRQELVQHVLVGPTATGGDVELVYAPNGMIQGIGSHPLWQDQRRFDWVGEWRLDDSGRVCTSLRVTGSYGTMALPFRCQSWFKYKEQYFLSDSDTDRVAKVFPRTIKK